MSCCQAGTGPLNPSQESTYSFLRTLVTEVMALFSTSDLFMMGGDEVPHDCWASNPEVLRFVKARGWGSNMEKLENYHAERVVEILAAQNRSVMCWQEVFESGAALDADSLVNVWSGGWEWCGYIRFHVPCTALHNAPEVVSSLAAPCSGWLVGARSLHRARRLCGTIPPALTSTGPVGRGSARCMCGTIVGHKPLARLPRLVIEQCFLPRFISTPRTVAPTLTRSGLGTTLSNLPPSTPTTAPRDSR